jgi:hypothetical protein
MGARPGALTKSAALAILPAVKHREHDNFVTIPRYFVDLSMRAYCELACTLIKAGTSHIYRCGGGQTAHPLAYTANNLPAARGLSFSIHAWMRSKQGFIDWPTDASGMRRQLCAMGRHMHRSKKTSIRSPHRRVQAAYRGLSGRAP